MQHLYNSVTTNNKEFIPWKYNWDFRTYNNVTLETNGTVFDIQNRHAGRVKRGSISFTQQDGAYFSGNVLTDNTDSGPYIDIDDFSIASPCTFETYFKFTDGEVIENPAENKRSYSSIWNNDAVGDGHARSMLDSPQAWSSKNNSVGEWVQMHLGSAKTVLGVVTQGRKTGHAQWINSFKVKYWVNNTWYDVDGYKTYTQGNTDNETKIINYFDISITAEYIRIYPQTYTGHMSMRAGVLVKYTNSWSRIIDFGVGRTNYNFLIARSGTTSTIKYT